MKLDFQRVSDYFMDYLEKYKIYIKIYIFHILIIVKELYKQTMQNFLKIVKLLGVRNYRMVT